MKNMISNSTPYGSPAESPNSSSQSIKTLLSSNSSSNLSNFSRSGTPNSTPSKYTWKNISSPEGSLTTNIIKMKDYSNDLYDTMPMDLPKYHPLNVLATQKGYYPNLSESQIIAVSLLKKKCIENKIDLYDDSEYEYLKLLRFLRARKFVVHEAYSLLTKDIEWRTYKVGLDLKYESAENVLHCDVGKLVEYYPAFIQGIDKQSRPICYRPGGFKIWKLLELTTFDNLIRFHSWETEQCLIRNALETKKTGYNIETFMVIVDASGFSLNLATPDGISFIKSMAACDSNHYPERLGIY